MRSTGLGIHIKVADISRSRQFYEGLLGFVPVFGYGNDEFRRTLPNTISADEDDGLPGAPERYCGVTYELTPHSPLEIADGHIAVPDPTVFSGRVPNPKVSAMLRVESLVPLVREKNVRPSFPIRHYYWRTIEMAIKDPDGFVLILIAPYSDVELDALREYVEVEVVNP
jgi:catechol 2,3-dioxygenase-like lactoylglutathione lyase family enzyme